MKRALAWSGEGRSIPDQKAYPARAPAEQNLDESHHGLGRELFAAFRAAAGTADRGAHIFGQIAGGTG